MVSQAKSPHRSRFPLSVIIAALTGCAAADVGFVIAAAPSLLLPDHLYGLFHLMLSSIALYMLAGILLAGYVLVLCGILRIFRYHPGGIAAIVMVVSFPAYMVCLKSLQAAMLGTYIGLRSPVFLVPIALSLIILFAAAGILAWISKRINCAFSIGRGRYGFGMHLLAFVIIFVIMGVAFGRKTNVLGIVKPDDQRTRVRERVLDPLPEAHAGSPNFVIAVIECFRSDHFTPENAPFLWKLAQENIYFSQYYTAAPATRPSVTSFFLSLYPVQHGCYNLAGGKTSDGTRMRVKVPASAEPFPGLLQDHGYRTMMVTSNSMVMDRAFGFERIYNRFSAADPYHFRAPFLEPFLGFQFLKSTFAYFRLFNVLVFSPEHSTTYFDGPRLNNTIRRELPEMTGSPFLLYVHYIEPHAPYYAHPYKPMQINLYLPSQREHLLDYYRQELAAADAVIADLYSYLEESGQIENTYLFITADHGEEFYDHGDWGHGKSLFPEVIHVPAILVAPPGLRRGVQVDRLVDNVDIAPTLVELAGLSPNETWEGESLADMFIPGKAGLRNAAHERPVMSQFDDGQLFYASIIADKYQMILRMQHGDERFSLFDLSVDPGAGTNVYGTGIAIEDSLMISLERALQRMHDTADQMSGEAEQVDEELMKQLKTLGYIE